MNTPPIYVTKPFIADDDAVLKAVTTVLQSGQFTNDGGQIQALQQELINYLDVPNISLFCNGTIALLMGLKALGLKGEVITTPFTFPATIHALEWLGLTPVFCDIDEATMCIAPDKIEALITKRTSAILGVHVYGMACDVMAIQAIADKHQLKVIYDAAHCFISKLHGKSIAHYGDISMFSFHATKLFSTIEGGGLVCRDASLPEKLTLMKNFGIKYEGEVIGTGLNGKMSEFHAAIGRVNLQALHQEIAKRNRVLSLYQQYLSGHDGIIMLDFPAHLTHSLQYLSVRLMGDNTSSKQIRNYIYQSLRDENIFARKYFYPLCSNYPCYQNLPSASKAKLPIANMIAEQILCLPFYGDLPEDSIAKICAIVTQYDA
ncbi:MAG: DegT/DnrJ/EryC1/StrS family aminotransferase [Alphaproteobacteria bacterium]|nr:DegT/DnrJ/EryC1/StrS family aminotransferase [Alphaproteobacteria bacterium]